MCWGRRTLVLACIIASLTLSGVSSAKKKKTAKILTLNTGLYKFLETYETRRDNLGAAIRDQDSDIVCLQSVFFENDMRDVMSTASQYPYVYSALHNKAGTIPPTPSNYGPCNNIDFKLKVGPCVVANCVQLTNDLEQLRSCVLDTCNALTLLDQQCVSCLVVSLQTGLECATALGQKMNLPGLVVMSKYPLKKANVVYFEDENTIVAGKRAFITADITGLGTITCTHMTPDVPGVPYFENLDYSSYAEQNFAEAETLASALKKKKRALLIGDINAGPDIPSDNIDGTLQGTYDLFVSSKFAPTHASTGNQCTLCSSNPLNKLTDDPNRIIDVVMCKKIKPASASIVLDGNIAGEAYPLSDHYGVEVVVKGSKKLKLP